MALYIPAGRRRRNTILAAVAAAIVGLGLGWVIGRTQAPSVTDRVARVQRDADELVTRVGALPIEYEQGIAGQGDSVQAGVLAPLTGIQRDTVVVLNRAPWIAQSGRDGALDAVASVKQAADDRVQPDRFAAVVRTAQSALRRAFGRT